MAIPDEVLLEFMQETTKAVTESSTKIAMFNDRMFGDNGIVEKLGDFHKTVTTQLGAHEAAITLVKEQRKSDKRVIHVVGGLLALEGSIIGGLLKYYSGIIAAAKAVLNHTGH